MKKSVAILLCLFIPIVISAQSVKAYYDDLCYTILLHNNTCWFSYPPEGYPEYSGEIVVPSTIKHKGSLYSVKKVEMVACSFFKNITSVILSEGIEEIQMSAFEGCSNLKQIHLPSTISKIGADAFSDTNLKIIKCDAETVPKTDPTSFKGVKMSEVTVIVPQTALKKYKESPVWGKFSYGQKR